MAYFFPETFFVLVRLTGVEDIMHNIGIALAAAGYAACSDVGDMPYDMYALMVEHDLRHPDAYAVWAMNAP